MVDYQKDILDIATTVASQLSSIHGSVGPWNEDADYRPAIVDELQARGYRTGEIRPLTTSVRTHRFDVIWDRDGVRGAIELKLPTRTSPADDARLFFRYDIKWLELGITAGHFTHGTAILLTDLRSLYEESNRGDWRHDYYRIGQANPHRCLRDGPDHLFDRKYAPGTQFLNELYPLRIDGCYDFRQGWTVISSGTSALYQLVVPVQAASPE